MPPPTPRAAEVEQDFRRLLAENALPEPDEVRHDPGEVVFLFRERKLAVVVDYEAEGADALDAADPLPADPLAADPLAADPFAAADPLEAEP
jgi:hypothetical protein